MLLNNVDMITIRCASEDIPTMHQQSENPTVGAALGYTILESTPEIRSLCAVDYSLVLNKTDLVILISGEPRKGKEEDRFEKVELYGWNFRTFE
jgi:hypothetical protein